MNKYRKTVGVVLGVTIALLALQWLRRHTDRETLQQRFWNPVYDRLAALYDAVDWFTGNTTQRLRRPALRYLPPAGARILEIGFGTGRLHVELAKRYRMSGLDLAPGMIALTRQRLTARGLTSELKNGSVYTIPWPDAHFDAVLSTFAFSAFSDGTAALDEMIRVVRPGRAIIITDAGEAADGNLFAHGLAKLWELLGDYMRDEVPLMKSRGLQVKREEYGPWHCVHCVSGTKPA